MKFIIGCLTGLIFMLFVRLLLFDSTRFEVETTINPILTTVENKMAVEYKLGDLLILDEWNELNAGQMIFLTKIAKKISVEKVYLTIKASSSDLSDDGFYYRIGNIEIFTKPVSWETLYNNVDSFPNVVWINKPESDELEKLDIKTESKKDFNKKL
jgi:hypothetical protein